MSATAPSGGRPGIDVLDAFGVTDRDVEPLQGGDEMSTRIDGVVFKRVGDPDVAAWTQSALSSIEPAGWTVPRPIGAAGGGWLVDGWTATTFVPGLRPFTDDPSTVVGIGVELAHLLADRSDDGSPTIRRRTDRWAVADRVAWGELDAASIAMPPAALDLIERLSAHLEPNGDPLGIVHGDLAGNIFLDARGTPVVLDLSPYVRPIRYGSAIVVIDHMLWFDAPTTLSRIVGHDTEGLARALMFRVVAHQLGPGDDLALTEFTAIVDAMGL